MSAFPDVTAIETSRTRVIPEGEHSFFYQLRLSPDKNQIYFTMENRPYIGVIANPNTPSIGCNITLEYIPLPSYTVIELPEFGMTLNALGLGSTIVSHDGMNGSYGIALDTTICENSFPFLLNAPSGFSDYQWNSGSTTPSLEVNVPGIFWVRSTSTCNFRVDTFIIQQVNIDVTIIGDSLICEGQTTTLSLSSTDYDFIEWQDGSTAPYLLVNSEDQYSVTVTQGLCTAQDTFEVFTTDGDAYILQNDTLICRGEPFILSVHSNPPAHSFLWNTGSFTPTLYITQPGQYSVTVSNQCGTYRDSVTIDFMDCHCTYLFPNVFTPNGDGLNDGFDVLLDCNRLTQYMLRIYNRFGECVFTSVDPQERWNGYYKNKSCDTGIYYYIMDIKEADNYHQYKGDILLIR